MSLLHLEDFAVGQSFDLGQHKFEADEIVSFATQYDPQPFHVDPDAAAASNFNGLIASGWQTGSVFMRLLVDGLLVRCASMGSPGVDELRWLAPVRPGDTLTATLHIEEVRPSKSRPDRGFIITRAVLTNQDASDVFTLRAPLMIRRRENPED
jgi:acyl dehydratase